MGFVGAPLHDMHHRCGCTEPGFTTVERWVGVRPGNTRGMTVVDYYFLTGNKPEMQR